MCGHGWGLLSSSLVVHLDCVRPLGASKFWKRFLLRRSHGATSVWGVWAHLRDQVGSVWGVVAEMPVVLSSLSLASSRAVAGDEAKKGAGNLW
jgi:hypothetical protein